MLFLSLTDSEKKKHIWLNRDDPSFLWNIVTMTPDLQQTMFFWMAKYWHLILLLTIIAGRRIEVVFVQAVVGALFMIAVLLFSVKLLWMLEIYCLYYRDKAGYLKWH